MPDIARDMPLETEHVLTTNVRQVRIARVYAEALLAAAKDEAADTGYELAGFVKDVLGKDKKVAAFFTSPAVTRKLREPILSASLKNNVSKLVASFIRVLNHNNRLELLPAIAAAYRELLDKRAGRVRVLVRSAVALNTEQQAEIRKMLSASLNKEPVLDLRTEPDLLGGLVVQVGDKVYDTSVRSRLEALRSQLTSRGSNVVKA
jgi:F-type H+-transporting ATPase subunit delta